MENFKKRFKETEWGPHLVEECGLSWAEVILVRNELENLGREWGGDDVLQIMEEIGVEWVKTIRSNSRISRVGIYTDNNDKSFQRAGKEMKRIIFLGKRHESEGD